MNDERIPLDAPLEDFTRHQPLKPGLPEGTDRAAAAHALINIAEDLARYLRVVSGGNLTIGILDNQGHMMRERQGLRWGDAHEAATGLGLRSTRRAVLDAQAAILNGQGQAGFHMAAHLGQGGTVREEETGDSHGA